MLMERGFSTICTHDILNAFGYDKWHISRLIMMNTGRQHILEIVKHFSVAPSNTCHAN